MRPTQGRHVHVLVGVIGFIFFFIASTCANSNTSDFRCFTGITTLSGTAGNVNSPTNACPGGYCAADWQLAFNPQSGQVGRFSVMLGPHQVDIDTLYGGASVKQALCSVDADAGQVVVSVRAGYQNGATTFTWLYNSALINGCDDALTSASLPDAAFMGMTLDIVVLDVGSWSSASADVQPQFALQSFETVCAAIAFSVPTTTPPSEYCYRFDRIALAPQGNDPYVPAFTCSNAHAPCMASLMFCIDAATQSQVSQLSVGINNQVCVTDGVVVQQALTATCVAGTTLLVGTTIGADEQTSIYLSFASNKDDTSVCNGSLRSATTSLRLEVVVEETRYVGVVGTLNAVVTPWPILLDEAFQLLAPSLLSVTDTPCSSLLSSSGTIHASDTVVCNNYCLYVRAKTGQDCTVFSSTFTRCEWIVNVTMTACSNGNYAVPYFALSVTSEDDPLHRVYTVIAMNNMAMAVCNTTVPEAAEFMVGSPPGFLIGPSPTWAVWPLAADFNCLDMWQQLPSLTLPLKRIEAYHNGQVINVPPIINTDTSLSHSICGASVPSPTSSPSASAGPPSATPSNSPSETTLPSLSSMPSASAAPSTLPSPSSPPPQEPAQCALRCKQGSGYYKNNPHDQAWSLISSSQRQLCGIDYSLLVDASSKQVRTAIPRALLRTAVRLVATLDLNLVGNLPLNVTDCTSELALQALPLNVSVAYRGIRVRYANATLCQPQTYSLNSQNEDDDDDNALSIIEQWVAALEWFFTTLYADVPTCDTLNAALMAQSNSTWQDARYEHTVEPVHLCTSRLSGSNDTCMSVFAYRNPNSECAFVPSGRNNRLIPSGVVQTTFGCWAPTEYFAPNVGGGLSALLNGTFAVMWHCKRYDSRHLTWRLGTPLRSANAPPPQYGSWVYRRADAYWLVDTCSDATIDYWFNYHCV